MVCDFKDAFHTLPINEAEKFCQVFRSGANTFDVFNTVVFGGVGSPLVWGRAAAFLMWSG